MDQVEALVALTIAIGSVGGATLVMMRRVQRAHERELRQALAIERATQKYNAAPYGAPRSGTASKPSASAPRKSSSSSSRADDVAWTPPPAVDYGGSSSSCDSGGSSSSSSDCGGSF